MLSCNFAKTLVLKQFFCIVSVDEMGRKRLPPELKKTPTEKNQTWKEKRIAEVGEEEFNKEQNARKLSSSKTRRKEATPAEAVRFSYNNKMAKRRKL